MRALIIGLLVVCAAPGCKDGQFHMPEMNEVREAVGAKAETSEEGTSIGEVTSSTAGDAKEGLDEKFGSEDDAADADASDTD